MFDGVLTVIYLETEAKRNSPTPILFQHSKTGLLFAQYVYKSHGIVYRQGGYIEVVRSNVPVMWLVSSAVV